jgi:hypothetical protein
VSLIDATLTFIGLGNLFHAQNSIILQLVAVGLAVMIEGCVLASKVLVTSHHVMFRTLLYPLWLILLGVDGYTNYVSINGAVHEQTLDSATAVLALIASVVLVAAPILLSFFVQDLWYYDERQHNQSSTNPQNYSRGSDSDRF